MSDLALQFARTAQQFPDHMALWSATSTLTYRELDEQSSALANWLLETRTSADSLLGIVIPKTAAAVIAILAGLKANMPYAPVDPSWPDRRRDSIFRQSGFDIVIADEGLSIADSTVLSPDTEQWQEIVSADVSLDVAGITRAPEDLAYILYTSGSTGDPKGVCVSHRAAFNFPDWARKEFAIGSDDRIASVAPLTFDLSTFDLFSTLCGGGTVYLVPDTVKMLPSSLARFLEQHEITTIYAVPSNLGLLVTRGFLGKRDLSRMKTVLFAGEVMPLPLFHELKAIFPDGTRFSNLYGPTETNVCTYFHMEDLADDHTAIPIGLPLPDTELFTLNADGSYGEAGAEGELCVDGPTVMSGYWGSNGSDADCWVATPGEEKAGAYRTGDFAKQADDGFWLYFGRQDGMVKIWGYRVELGEVESCILTHGAIDQAAVVKVSHEDELGDSLLAFAVATPGESVAAIDIVNYCRQNLPPYMCPKTVNFIDEIPLSQNGKIERRQLTALANQSGQE